MIHTDVLLKKHFFALKEGLKDLSLRISALSISGHNIMDYLLCVAVMFRIFFFFAADDVWSRSILQESLRRQGVNAFNVFVMKNTYKSSPSSKSIDLCNVTAERNHNIT